MAEKITVEEEKELLPIKFLKPIKETITQQPDIEQIKDRMLRQLSSLIIPISQDLVMLKENQMVIEEELGNELCGDFYMDLPVSSSINHYIKISKNYDLKRQMFIQVLCEAIKDILMKINEINISPKQQIYTFPEEHMMPLEEKEAYIGRITKFVQMWKMMRDNHQSTNQKALGYKIYHTMVGTDEQFLIADNIFFEVTGERVLSKMKARKESEKEAKAEPEVNTQSEELTKTTL